MLVLEGGLSYGRSHCRKLYAACSSLAESSDIQAHYVYCIQLSAALSEGGLKQLLSILPDSKIHNNSIKSQTEFYVFPRQGTVSPWSSKAQDIVTHCGLNEVLRIERGIRVHPASQVTAAERLNFHDPMTEQIVDALDGLSSWFDEAAPRPLAKIALYSEGVQALIRANDERGLALSASEIDYLHDLYQKLGRDPTAAELMMFAQVNSEHCRHKIFNASWTIDGKAEDLSLFSMIRNTHKLHPQNVLVAYNDNAAVLRGSEAQWFYPDPHSHRYAVYSAQAPIVLKVETHNHPTAIAPFAGAATGAGGEIRDEAATGRGAKAKAGMCGFSVSHLHIPGYRQPWEMPVATPAHMASALEIMIQGPIGAAAFNNEFGRPNICGYFRSFLMKKDNQAHHYWGYHKPIMLAGGIGVIKEQHIQKQNLPPKTALIVLGGPAFAIGLGGGSASSRTDASGHHDLDFASVQRANPEMQRRAQEVINACWSLGDTNPILSIHDVGAGGLSNALPEIIAAVNKGAVIDLRAIHRADQSLSPMEIWCNESQERYVLAIAADDVDAFAALCQRERCPYCVVGHVTEQAELKVHDPLLQCDPIDLSLDSLLEKMPPLVCEDQDLKADTTAFDYQTLELSQAIERVLQYPCVASKSFLITIADRSVGGLVARDQMVGPWQVPVADVAVTNADFVGVQGEAMAVGERAPVACINAAASARLAVGEAITNIAAASICDIKQIALSANWMASPQTAAEGAALYAAVKAIGMELCPELGIAIPVGKDSLSMRCAWQDQTDQTVTSPVSVAITAAAPVDNVNATLTPQLQADINSQLILIDLGEATNALGGSVLAQVYQQLGSQTADVRSSDALKNFFLAIQACQQRQLLQAYHDRSDGGLLACICEMMFAAHCGVSLDLSALAKDTMALLFNEELGAVIQVAPDHSAAVKEILVKHHLQDHSHIIGQVNTHDELRIVNNGDRVYQNSRVILQQLWAKTSYHIQALRDNPDCAKQEFSRIADSDNPGIKLKLNLDEAIINAPFVNTQKPKVAILREQGVNGHVEMAAALYYAGCEVDDVHMSDLMQGKSLAQYSGLVACGGFSYGDVLGAGRGWAQTILNHPGLQQEFQQFFHRPDTFSLGVCNGCQMLSHLKALIPGAAAWPEFVANDSEQFESRLLMVRIEDSASCLLQGLAGSVVPVVVAHGEGRAEFTDKQAATANVVLRYSDAYGVVTESYPDNPNGSLAGVAGLCSDDGRALIMMPHPERVFRQEQHSYWPGGDIAPWAEFFKNARRFCQSL